MDGLDIKLDTKEAVNSIRIGVAGFESHSQAAMKLFFVQQEQFLSLVPLAQAEVLILDMEHPSVPSLIDQYKNMCAIVAVTATEKVFDGLVTVSKPLNSRQLITAIRQAKQEFMSVSASQSGELLSDGEVSREGKVSREGEKAFQEYQKRIATGRQAMESYQQRAAGRDSITSQLQEQYAPKESIQLEVADVDDLNADSQSDSLLADNQVSKPSVKPQAEVVLPVPSVAAKDTAIFKSAVAVGASRKTSPEVRAKVTEAPTLLQIAERLEQLVLEDDFFDERAVSEVIDATESARATRPPETPDVSKESEAPEAASKASVLPVIKKVAQKKPEEVRAKLSYQMVYECCGNAPDINMHEREQRRRVFYKDDATLLAILQQAMTPAAGDGMPVEISGLPGTLAYLPDQDCFLFDFSEDLLIPLSLTRFGYQELSLKLSSDIDVNRSSIADTQVIVFQADELLWKIALWTSKGRLNYRIDPEKPQRLAYELDFDRLLAIPHAATINSLWRRHSLSVLEVVRVLKISQRYVFSFMSAAHALGAFE